MTEITPHFFDPKIIGTVGIILDIVGVIVLFRFGFPQPDLNPTNYLALSGDMSENERTKEKRRKYIWVSLFGLAALILGFSLQIIALWI